MSKRGKDLFYLLEQRERGGHADEPEARPRSAPGARGRSSLGTRVRHWFAGAGAGNKSGRAPAVAHPAAAPYGLVLAAVALVSLGVGFALGRFLPQAQAASDLAARGEGSAPRRPGPIDGPGEHAKEAAKPWPGPGAGIAAEKEEEILSNRFYRLLQFESAQRAQAVQAASHLLAHGVDTARIRKFNSQANGRELWLVVAYAVAPATAASLLAKLKAVPASRTWSNLTARLGKLSAQDIEHYDK